MDTAAAKRSPHVGHEPCGNLEAPQGRRIVRFARIGVDGEHRGLGSYACDGVRRLKLAYFFDREGITFRFDVDVPSKTFGVDGGGGAAVVPDGEVERDERVARPIEQTNRQSVVRANAIHSQVSGFPETYCDPSSRNRLSQCFSSRVILTSD